MIGYDAEILRLLLAQYDAGLRPMQPVALLLALAATWLALRPPARAQGWSPRAVAAVLALAWAWIGYGWLWSVMAGLDFFAPVPAAMKRRFSPAICSACIRVTLKIKVGGWKF